MNGNAKGKEKRLWKVLFTAEVHSVPECQLYFTVHMVVKVYNGCYEGAPHLVTAN